MEEHTVTANSEMVPIKEDPDIAEEEDEEIMVGCDAVSYTHLTLPTICSV